MSYLVDDPAPQFNVYLLFSGEASESHTHAPCSRTEAAQDAVALEVKAPAYLSTARFLVDTGTPIKARIVNEQVQHSRALKEPAQVQSTLKTYS